MKPTIAGGPGSDMPRSTESPLRSWQPCRTYEVQPLDLSAVITGMREMLNASVSRKDRVHHDLPPGLPPMKGDLSQIRQVIVNLVMNASEALEENEGTFHRSTRRAPV